MISPTFSGTGCPSSRGGYGLTVPNSYDNESRSADRLSVFVDVEVGAGGSQELQRFAIKVPSEQLVLAGQLPQVTNRAGQILWVSGRIIKMADDVKAGAAGGAIGSFQKLRESPTARVTGASRVISRLT